MPHRQLHQLSDLSHLLLAATNVIVANLIKNVLGILALKWLAFIVNNRILSDYTVLWFFDLNDFELDLPHSTTTCENVTLAYWSIGFAKIGSDEDIEEVASKTFDSVGNREDSDPLGEFDVR